MSKKRKKKALHGIPVIAPKHPGITWIMLIYFCSGVCSLIDEVVWVRLLKLTLGNTVYASSIVVSMFMGGLALGALIMGRYADRVQRHLRLYAFLEVCVTITALAMPWTLRLADGVYRWIYITWSPSPTGLLGVQIMVSAALLLVPTMLMGSTLPLLGRYVTSLEDRMGHRVGRLYALNTLGAALGCFLAGFLFVRMVGVMGTLYIAAAINLFVALGGWVLSRSYDKAARPTIRHADKKATNTVGSEIAQANLSARESSKPYVLLLAFFISGLVSIGYELIWMRSIVVPLGGFTYVFSAVLTAYLLGNVIGAWIGSILARRLKHPAVAFGLSLSCLGIFGLLYIPWFRVWFPGGANWMLTQLMESERIVGIHKALFPFVHSLILFLIPALTMGIGFPLALQAWNQFQHQVGQTTGQVYGANTIGAVLGGIVTGFLLIPWLGVQRSITFLGLTSIWLGTLMIWIYLPKIRFARQVGSAFIALGATIAALLIPSDLFIQYIAHKHQGRLLSIKEGITTTVAISEKPDGHRLMAIDNVQMAGDDIHRSAQKTLGHLGVLLHRNPREVCTFGFGCGETTACLARHKLDRIDCVEIAPEVVEVALEYFPHINLGEELPNQVNMIYMDGKNYLKLTDRRYDIIINDSNVHSTSGSAPLFTREHFQNSRDHLVAGGMFLTKLHLQGHPKSNFESILATFMEVFPHVTVWFPTTKPFVFFYLVGSREPQRFSPSHIDRVLNEPAVRESVDYLYFRTSADVLSCYIGDKQDFQRYLDQPPVNSDFRPYIEFNLDPKHLVMRDYFPQLIEAVRRGSLKTHLDFSGFSPAAREQWIQDFDQLNQVASLVLRAHGEQAFLSKLLYSYHGLKLLPGYLPLLDLQEQSIAELERALRRGRVNSDQVIATMNTQLRRYPDLALAWLIESVVWNAQGKPDQALKAGETSRQLAPRNAVILNYLGKLYLQQNQAGKAQACFTEAVRKNPNHYVYHFHLAESLRRGNLLDQAANEYRQALQLHPNFLPARRELHKIISDKK